MKHDPTYHFSASDIERYVNGLMTAAEMHALEKAALEDPFLADAIEGIREMKPDLIGDLSELKTRLKERTDDKVKRVGWLTMVAAAGMVISLSFASWLMFKTEKGPILAKLEKNTIADSLIISNQPNPKIADTIVVANQVSPSASKPQADLKQAPAAESLRAAEPVATVPSASVADAEILAQQKIPQTATNTDVPGKSEEVKPEALSAKKKTAPQKELAAPSAEAAGIQLRSKTDEVKYSFDISQGAAEPLGGWTAFRKYLTDSLRRPSGSHAGLKGLVPVSFQIKPDGNIENLTVEKSLHPEYDKEALRLLKNGPKWKISSGASGTKTTVSIIF